MYDLIDVGQASVEATVRAARPTAKTALKAASNPITASEESMANRLSVSTLHTKNDKPVATFKINIINCKISQMIDYKMKLDLPINRTRPKRSIRKAATISLK